MGICEYRGDRNIVYTTKCLMDRVPGSTSTSFYFSTEPLFKLDADCLLILSNDYVSIKNNAFVKSLRDKPTAAEICHQFETVSKQNKPQFGQIISFSLFVGSLEFSKYAVMCISEAEFQHSQSRQGTTPHSKPLEQIIKQNLHQLTRNNIQNVAITELEWKNQSRKLEIFSTITRTIVNDKSLKSVVFACLSEKTQNMYMKIVEDMLQRKH